MTSSFGINNMNGISDNDRISLGINNMNGSTNRDDISFSYTNLNGVSDRDNAIYRINDMNGISFTAGSSSPTALLTRIIGAVNRTEIFCRHSHLLADAK